MRHEPALQHSPGFIRCARLCDERRARADLEALVETSPVGVAVFDAGTGAVLSFNREAQRIVEGLRDPAQAPEDLLQVLICRHADGREIALGELPMAALLSNAETFTFNCEGMGYLFPLYEKIFALMRPQMKKQRTLNEKQANH